MMNYRKINFNTAWIPVTFIVLLFGLSACSAPVTNSTTPTTLALSTRTKPVAQESETTVGETSPAKLAEPTATMTTAPTETAEPTSTSTATATAEPTGTPTQVPEQANAADQLISPENAPVIEVGNQSGVIGYSIGLFGQNFGSTAGTVTILGASAQVETWTNSFVQVKVPSVADGEGDLVLTTAGSQSVSHPFTTYTINPVFREIPDSFTNIAFGRESRLIGLEDEFCFSQPSNQSLEARFFLTDFTCGFQGVNNTGSATFSADSSMGKVAVIAIDLGQDIAGDLWIQTFSDSSWYPVDSPFTSVMANYDIQVSPDSTNGTDGTWVNIQSIENNNRVSRLHRVTVPSAGHRWMRIHIRDGAFDTTSTPGKDFKVREIRVYKPNGTANKPDSFALYGDSLTAGAFDAINQSGLASHIQAFRGNNNDMIMVTMGLSGQNGTGLTNNSGSVNDIYDALALDNMESNVRYWGISIGTNDAGDGAAGLQESFTNVSQYDERLEAIVADLISKGRVPIVARIPDTVESRGGFGDLEAKRKVLADIDRIAAEYKLIPGPDFYTLFRYNIETAGGSWLGDDGTHHTPAGEAVLIDYWADAFVRGTTGGQAIAPTPVPTREPIPTIDPATALFTYFPISLN